MARKDPSVQAGKKEALVVVEGVVTGELPALEYEVKINFQGIDHALICYVSGKMRKNFIQIRKGDKVEVAISLYNIDKGRIIKRLTNRKPVEVVTEINP